MKSLLPKTTLILSMLCGVLLSLFLYTQILSILSRVMDVVGYNWISLGVIFVISVWLARLCFRVLNDGIKNKNDFNKLSLFMMLKFFVGGFIGCYTMYAIVGSLVLIVLMVFRATLNIG